MDGHIHTIANGHLSYEIYDADANFMFTIATFLESRFGFTIGKLIDGIDTYHIDCHNNDIRMGIGWDNWSGCFLMAFDDKGDKIIQEFAEVFAP